MTLKEFLITILSLTTVLLFSLNYPIAEYLSPQSLDWDKNIYTRFDIYALIMALYCCLTQVKHNKYSKFILSIGLGFCIGDVLDRFVFHCVDFHIMDILGILLGLYVSYKKEIHAYYVSRRS